MIGNDVIVKGNSKKVNELGTEYWSARESQAAFGYHTWANFEKVIRKAIEACVNLKQEPDHHFWRIAKSVHIGSDATRNILDFQLSRFACYLIVQNGDARKREISGAQEFFALQAFKKGTEEAPKTRTRKINFNLDPYYNG